MKPFKTGYPEGRTAEYIIQYRSSAGRYWVKDVVSGQVWPPAEHPTYELGGHEEEAIREWLWNVGFATVKIDALLAIAREEADG